MRAKKFFNKLNSELNDALPKMSQDLLDAPVPPCYDEEPQEIKSKNFDFNQFFTAKRIGALASALIICVIAVFSGIVISGRFSRVSDSVIVQIDINPSIELLLDENMQVVKIVSNNADGDVLIFEDGFIESVVGKNVEDAVKIIAQKATDCGFIDYKDLGSENDYNNIKVTAIGNKQTISSDLFVKIESSLCDYFFKNGVFVFIECIQNDYREFDQKLTTLQDKTQFYYDTIKSDLSVLRDYLSQLIFEYCTVLLEHSIHEYDLLTEIAELNAQIKEKYLLGYWLYYGDDQEILNLCAQIEQKLDLLDKGHDIQITNEISLETLLLIYNSDVDIDALRELLKTGIDETLFSFDNDLLTDFLVISAENFIEEVIGFYKELTTSDADSLVDFVDLLIEKLEGVRKHSSTRPELEVITGESYLEFLKRINRDSVPE